MNPAARIHINGAKEPGRTGGDRQLPVLETPDALELLSDQQVAVPVHGQAHDGEHPHRERVQDRRHVAIGGNATDGRVPAVEHVHVPDGVHGYARGPGELRVLRRAVKESLAGAARKGRDRPISSKLEDPVADLVRRDEVAGGVHHHP